MIPPFNENGYLPPGVYAASLEEILDRFGRGSEQRQAQAESLRWLVSLCRKGGISRLLLNGSFVTDRLKPNDVDCVLLQEAESAADVSAALELRQG